MKEIGPSVLEQLKAIATHNGWDEIYEDKALFDGRPVFQLRNSAIPWGAKVGYPHLYSVDEELNVFALSLDEIRTVSQLRDGVGNLIEQLPSPKT
ncbi:hypothetical protein [Porphyromonas uenonis]|jgi:hypothetical protein|uniref:hypothetical protein n=1 Tax=Porphyromonas uenonis TaxID=281920 RepID=UPI0026EF8546|nr:hypothetical protein [Porphyromonas uenonis]